VLDGGELLMADLAEVHALGQVLAHEPVGVLVRSALPGAVGIAEEDVHLQHEPADTACFAPGCGQAMARVGEDVSEELDIVPAEFFVHRHIYGESACRCCERLVQEPADPQIIDCGMPASGLVAHTLISRFADHLPYYRLEAINARADETPLALLDPGAGKTKKAYLWGYARGVFDA
jgi:transposase